MDFTLALKALIMGLVEGFTEFLPISSTGHLILAGSLLDFTGDKIKVFEIVIQAGAMLAVCWEYRQRIGSVLSGLLTDAKSQKFVLNLVIAFLPAAALGLLLGKVIKASLFKPVPVALAFIIGGFVILWVERRNLIAQRLAAAGRHQHQRIAALRDMLDDFSLLAAEGRITEHGFQHLKRFGEIAGIADVTGLLRHHDLIPSR